MLLMVLVGLTACGEQSQENVVEKVSGTWANTKGYELDAEMTMQSGGEAKKFDVTVWHAKPDFYRVKVTPSGGDASQLIIRNEEGVFVVTPSLKKTYKFQSDWPKENSQPYLIGALAEDILADKKLVMKEKGNTYVFETATRNNQKGVLPSQIITVDKKTMLPMEISVLNEAKEEQIHLTFNNVKLNVKRDAKEFAVEQFKATAKDTKEQVSASVTQQPFETYYPVLKWQGTKQVDDQTITENGVERVVLTYEGDKAFTLMQEPTATTQSVVPVSVAGDPADLGFTIGAITDHSLNWEMNGVSFFLASNDLTRAEMIEVAASMNEGGMK